jgi:3-isopropylmalate/(R)-2-methylmalate dehydratase small subunit
VATVDIDTQTILHHGTGKTYSLKPLGEVRPVIDAGGIFDYARQSGMIAQKA